jgi:hypothetical protein
MLYLVASIGSTILDLDGERVATLRDVIVRLGEEDHPPVAGLSRVIGGAISLCRAGASRLWRSTACAEF